jgi:hypothetical protein
MAVQLVSFSSAADQPPEEKKPDSSDKAVAKYKIEVMFGKDRSTSSLKPSIGMLLTWVSGKHYHGGGDEQMMFCGGCNRPVNMSYVAAASMICPHCHVESFTSEYDKIQHVNYVRSQGGDVNSFQKMPCCSGEKIFRLAPPKLAKLIEKTWFQLDCNADIYLKYHPSDIRYVPQEVKATAVTKILDSARSKRQISIYPLHRILKDIEAGATAWKQFLAFITA